MKFINPFGRKVGDGVQPKACLCNTGYGYADARTSDAYCSCGCNSNGTTSYQETRLNTMAYYNNW